jgi:hypothetical protein
MSLFCALHIIINQSRQNLGTISLDLGTKSLSRVFHSTSPEHREPHVHYRGRILHPCPTVVPASPDSALSNSLVLNRFRRVAYLDLMA